MIRVTSNAHFIVVHHVDGAMSFTLSPIEANELIGNLMSALEEFAPGVSIDCDNKSMAAVNRNLDAEYAGRVAALMEDYNWEFSEALAIVREVDFIGE